MSELEMMPEPQPEQKAYVEHIPQEIAEALQILRRNMMDDLKERLAADVDTLIGDIQDSVLSNTRLESSALLRGLDIYTADIESHCLQLKQQVDADRYDGSLPVIEIPNSNVIPIAEAEINTLHQNGMGGAFRIKGSPIRVAVNGFFTELKSFVQHRLVGSFFFPRVDALVGGLNGLGTTLPVTVYSHYTLGARVEYSPAYFIAFTSLAAPTSPARGAVAPGRYIFKLTKGNNHFYDGGVFDIPDTYDVYLTV